MVKFFNGDNFPIYGISFQHTWPNQDHLQLHTYVTHWVKTRHFHRYWIQVKGNLICTPELGLLYQHVAGGFHCIMKPELCYYKEAISLNSQAGQWNTGTQCYGQLVTHFPTIGSFTNYGLYIAIFVSSYCLFQLSLPTFKLPFCKNASILHDTIIYRDSKVYCNNVKTLFSCKVAFCIRDAFCSITLEPSYQLLSLPHNYTLIYRFLVLA